MVAKCDKITLRALTLGMKGRTKTLSTPFHQKQNKSPSVVNKESQWAPFGSAVLEPDILQQHLEIIHLTLIRSIAPIGNTSPQLSVMSAEPGKLPHVKDCSMFTSVVRFYHASISFKAAGTIYLCIFE